MRLIDLTLPVSPELPSFPGSPPPQFVPWSEIGRDGYNMELLFMSSHAGTHIDAPYHFARRGARVDQIPLGRLMGEGILLGTRAGAGARITKSGIRAAEQKHGRIWGGAPVFIRTGWQRNLKRPNYFTANPGLSAAAARYLASKKVGLVGTDSPSIDAGGDGSFPAHRILAAAGIPIVENLANMERLATGSLEFVILPLKLKGASGSPVRAVAAQR